MTNLTLELEACCKGLSLKNLTLHLQDWYDIKGEPKRPGVYLSCNNCGHRVSLLEINNYDYIIDGYELIKKWNTKRYHEKIKECENKIIYCKEKLKEYE